MSTPARLVWPSFLAFAALICIASIGCAPLQPLGSKPPGLADATPAGPTCTVVLTNPGAKPQQTQMPLTGRECVQDALDLVEAPAQFRRVEVQVLRHAPPTDTAKGGMIKMAVKYDSAKREVRPDSNYALHPGDRVVIVQTTANTLDDAVGSLGPPLGRMFGGRK